MVNLPRNIWLKLFQIELISIRNPRPPENLYITDWGALKRINTWEMKTLLKLLIGTFLPDKNTWKLPGL